MQSNRRILPGFRISLGIAISYLMLMVIIPLIVAIAKVSTLTSTQFLNAVWTERARAAYWLTLSTSLYAAIIDTFIGLLLAWVLVRYEFPGKRLLDSLVDLPFALPTAVAGLVYSTLYVGNGWYGQFLVPLGIEIDNTNIGIVIVLVFIGLPFVVRTLQPVLESMDADVEEAAASMGASRCQIIWRVLLPPLAPALWTGFALTLARALGEYGSLTFIAANKPYESEIVPVMIVSRIEEGAMPEATAIAMVMLFVSFCLLVVINYLEWRSGRYAH
jgi:sulfate transport system permease protein